MDRRRAPTATPFIPAHRTLASLSRAAAGCRGCDLYRNATQTVFGEGPEEARVLFIGEQPGDKEDRMGHPFVGPAGRVLDRAIVAAGIRREEVFVTNAVKHFKWELRGKRRIHKKPGDLEIDARFPWLMAEVELVKPQVVVCMGTTAARAGFGRTVRIRDLRGGFHRSLLSEQTFVTPHPSSILRLPEKPQRDEALTAFISDLAQVAARLSV